MAIAAALLALVGPLTLNSIERAQAKTEMLSFKNWLRKISYRAYTTGTAYRLSVAGKRAELTELAAHNNDETLPVLSIRQMEALFFQPQHLVFNEQGFVYPSSFNVTYRDQSLTIDLSVWVNGNEEK